MNKKELEQENARLKQRIKQIYDRVTPMAGNAYEAIGFVRALCVFAYPELEDTKKPDERSSGSNQE